MPADYTEALVQDARREPSSFQSLYDRVAPSLMAWLSLKMPPALRRQMDPVDLLQETWLRAYQSFDSFDPSRGEFRPWVFGIASRTILNAFRTLNRRPDQARPEGQLHSGVLLDQATRVSEAVRRDERVTELILAIGELEDDAYELATTHGLAGVPLTDLARQLGISHAATKKRWQRVREGLRGKLSDVSVLN